MSTPFETAQRIQQTLQKDVTDIRNDATLSDAGKAQKLTAAYKQATTKMASVKQAHAEEVENEYESLRKSVFGLSFKMGTSDADRAAARGLYRDALDRTATLKTEQDALNMIETAHLTGDATLLKAASLAAYRNQWGKALAAYAEIEPDGARRIRELQDAESASQDPMQRLGQSMSFALTRPPEVDPNAGLDAVAASRSAAASDA